MLREKMDDCQLGGPLAARRSANRAVGECY